MFEEERFEQDEVSEQKISLVKNSDISNQFERDDISNVYSSFMNHKYKPKKVSYHPNWFMISLSLLALLGVILGGFQIALTIQDALEDYNGATSIEVSKPVNNRVVVETVEGSDKLYTASGIYKNNIESIVAIQTEVVTTNLFGQQVAGAAAGSGFVISEDGYILTNAHVVSDASSIKVSFENGTEYDAKLVGMEEDNDIAVLKIDSSASFNPVTFGDSDKMTIGEDIVAIGNPLGELTFSLTKGVVSALDREITTDVYSSINMFQVDCAVNQGNSGGPVFNMYGEVVGIVSAKYASNTIEGLGFCIPVNDVAGIVTELIEHGKVTNKAYMGIIIADVTPNMVKQYNMVQGAYVQTVIKGSCAEKAGLKIGDIIVEMDGKEVKSVSGLMAEKRSYKAGETAKLKVWRGGDYINVSITFDEETEAVEDVPEITQPNVPSQGNIPNQNPQYNWGGGNYIDPFEFFFGF